MAPRRRPTHPPTRRRHHPPPQRRRPALPRRSGRDRIWPNRIWPNLTGRIWPTLFGRIWPILFDRIWQDRIRPFFFLVGWWGPEGEGARRGGGPKGWGPEGLGARRVGGARNFALFFSPTGNFILSTLSGRSSRGILVVFLKAGALICARLEFSGCRVKPRRPPTGGEEVQRRGAKILKTPTKNLEDTTHTTHTTHKHNLEHTHMSKTQRTPILAKCGHDRRRPPPPPPGGDPPPPEAGPLRRGSKGG